MTMMGDQEGIGFCVSGVVTLDTTTQRHIGAQPEPRSQLNILLHLSSVQQTLRRSSRPRFVLCLR